MMQALPVLDFPAAEFRFRNNQGSPEIFDFIRRRYVALTPEEWVRQHTLHFLHIELGIPAGLITVEKSLVLNKMTKRADVLVSNPAGEPRLLIECKAPTVSVNQRTFEQISRYNLVFRVPFLIVTNGITHFCFLIDFMSEKITRMDHFPQWDELK